MKDNNGKVEANSDEIMSDRPPKTLGYSAHQPMELIQKLFSAADSGSDKCLSQLLEITASEFHAVCLLHVRDLPICCTQDSSDPVRHDEIAKVISIMDGRNLSADDVSGYCDTMIGIVRGDMRTSDAPEWQQLAVSASGRRLGTLHILSLNEDARPSDLDDIRTETILRMISLCCDRTLMEIVLSREEKLRQEAENALHGSSEWDEFKVQVASVFMGVDEGVSETMYHLAERIASFFDVVCDIQLVERQTDSIIPIAVYHSNEEVRKKIQTLFSATRFRVGQGMIGSVIAEGRELYMPGIPLDIRKAAKKKMVDISIMPSSFAYLPLAGQDSVFGTINFSRLQGQDAISTDELLRMRDLARYLSVFIDMRLSHIGLTKELKRRKKTERKIERISKLLEKSERETLGILNTVPIMIARISKDLRYTFLNEKYLKMGVDPRLMEGRFIHEVLGEATVTELKPRFERVLNGEVVKYDYDGTMADGVHRYFNVALAPDHAPDGSVQGFYSCASEVTGRFLAEEQVRLGQDRLNTLTINSGDAYFLHDLDQNIHDVNSVAISMLGYSREELLDMSAQMVDPRWKENAYLKFLDSIEFNVPQTFETTVLHKDGHAIPVEVRFVKIKEQGKTMIQSLVRDRTARQIREQMLKESEERLRLIFENVEDYICTCTPEGILDSVNRTSQGLTKEDVIGASIYDFYHDESTVAEVRLNFGNLKLTGESFVIEDQYAGPDGSVKWHMNKFIGVFHEETFIRAVIIIRDVTLERNREHSMMSAMLKGQEEERKRVGAELHDGIGQVLSAISLELSQINMRPEADGLGSDNEKLAELDKKIQTAIREVRNISHDLMPEVLESFGLWNAIGQICESLRDTSDMSVRFDHASLKRRYGQTIEVNFYRIAQELLNNIHKHAECSKVFVTLIGHDGKLSLTVEDDGKGFDPSVESHGIGLKNVASRVNMLNGQMDIESTKESGTLINIEIPVKTK